MDRLFIDTNVIIDYLAARQPFDASAKVLFQLAEERQIEICASVLSLCNIIYRKISPGSNIRQILSDLSVLVHVTSVDNVVFTDANASLFADIEDAVQHFSALHHGGIHYLITRDP